MECPDGKECPKLSANATTPVGLGLAKLNFKIAVSIMSISIVANRIFDIFLFLKEIKIVAAIQNIKEPPLSRISMSPVKSSERIAIVELSNIVSIPGIAGRKIRRYKTMTK